MKRSVFFDFLKSNKISFTCIILCFIIGMTIGITFMNCSNAKQIEEISEYVNSLKDNIKLADNINKNVILIKSLKQNLLIVFLIWILGCTLFGGFLIYGILIYKGFSIGYTVSAIISSLGPRVRDNFFNCFIIIAKFDIFTSNIYVI